MSSNRDIRFMHGPFQGWQFAVTGIYDGGEIVRILARLNTGRLAGGECRDGLLSFSPEMPGFDVMLSALNGVGRESMEEPLTWVIDATRDALDNRSDITSEHRAYWQTIVDGGDHARAEFFAKYPDGRVPAFEVVGALSVTA